jgi:hypothetical protein
MASGNDKSEKLRLAPLNERALETTSTRAHGMLEVLADQ